MNPPLPSSPPDRIVVPWCSACGLVLDLVAVEGKDAMLPMGPCPHCGARFTIRTIRYQLAVRRGENLKKRVRRVVHARKAS